MSNKVSFIIDKGIKGSEDMTWGSHYLQIQYTNGGQHYILNLT